MPDAPRDSLDPLRRSQLLRILVIGGLVLLLQIPIGMIRRVIGERQATRNEAVAEVSGSWGRAQHVVGPRLVVPFHARREWTDADGETHVKSTLRRGVFLPRRLEVEGDLAAERRHRGIFEVPVYRGELHLRGSFARPVFDGWSELPPEILWERAYVVVDVADPRALDAAAALTWNDEAHEMLPGGAPTGGAAAAIHAPIGVRADVDEAAFELDLALRGSDALALVPLGRETEAVLRADWPDPSFQGAWLPTDHEIDAEGFTARWRIPFLGRGFAQRFPADALEPTAFETTRFGVELATPVDPYRMAERSAKYAALFLLLTFGTLWLFEVLADVRIHPVQYLLVGAAMCLFYLLELSLAEHLGFGVAYVLASVGVVGLIGAYAAAVLRRAGRAAAVAGVVAALYGYLFVLLTNEAYALLAGSLGLFAALALVMFLTRRVDWDALGRRIGEGATGGATDPSDAS